jgi:hypothetical protein
MVKELNTKKLFKMPLRELYGVADQMATKLQWLHSTGQNESRPDVYKRLALELYHVSQIIETKEANKVNKKFDY